MILPRLLFTANPSQFMKSAKCNNYYLRADSNLLPDSASAQALNRSHSGYHSARPWPILLSLLTSSCSYSSTCLSLSFQRKSGVPHHSPLPAFFRLCLAAPSPPHTMKARAVPHLFSTLLSFSIQPILHLLRKRHTILRETQT